MTVFDLIIAHLHLIIKIDTSTIIIIIRLTYVIYNKKLKNR